MCAHNRPVCQTALISACRAALPSEAWRIAMALAGVRVEVTEQSTFLYSPYHPDLPARQVGVVRPLGRRGGSTRATRLTRSSTEAHGKPLAQEERTTNGRPDPEHLQPGGRCRGHRHRPLCLWDAHLHHWIGLTRPSGSRHEHDKDFVRRRRTGGGGLRRRGTGNGAPLPARRSMSRASPNSRPLPTDRRPFGGCSRRMLAVTRCCRTCGDHSRAARGAGEPLRVDEALAIEHTEHIGTESLVALSHRFRVPPSPRQRARPALARCTG